MRKAKWLSQAKFNQLSDFEEGRIFGMGEVGLLTRDKANPVGRYVATE